MDDISNDEFRFKLIMLSEKIKYIENQKKSNKPFFIAYLVISIFAIVALISAIGYSYLYKLCSIQTFALLSLPCGGIIYAIGQLSRGWSNDSRIIENFH
ncbi:MAG: hypothetical protein QM764_24420 [Chitinophagaceae bacterium]